MFGVVLHGENFVAYTLFMMISILVSWSLSIIIGLESLIRINFFLINSIVLTPIIIVFVTRQALSKDYMKFRIYVHSLNIISFGIKSVWNEFDLEIMRV